MLIKALARLPDDVACELRVLGDGPLERRWRRLVKRLHVEHRITWMGMLPREEAMRHYDWADVFVFTSLRDTTGTVVLRPARSAGGVPRSSGRA